MDFHLLQVQALPFHGNELPVFSKFVIKLKTDLFLLIRIQ